MTDIHVINLGMVNVYLIQGNGCILVDTGTKGKADKILKEIKKRGINPTDIKLIVLTHGHADHIGSLEELKKKTGAKVLMDQLEYKILTLEEKDNIKPIALFVKFIFWLNEVRNIKPKKLELPADILVEDTYNLKEFGVNGKIIKTPGHSMGSISVLLDDGQVIIGDNLMAMMPWSKPNLPILAVDLKIVKISMEKLIDMGAKRFYLSHGKDYSVEDINDILIKN